MKNTIFTICLTALLAFIAYIWYVQEEYTTETGEIAKYEVVLGEETVAYTSDPEGVQIYLEKYTKLRNTFNEVKKTSASWWASPGEDLASFVNSYRNLYGDKSFIKMVHFPEYKYMYTLGLAMLSISDHYKWSYSKSLERALNLNHQQRLELIKGNAFSNVRYEDIKILEQ